MTVASKPRTLTASETLVFRRLRTVAAVESAAGYVLGGRWVGNATQAIQAPLLAPPESAVFDAWLSGSTQQACARGCISFTTDGNWLHGCAEIDDRASGLEAAAYRAYSDLFAVLSESDCPHLLRIWNYFADINRETVPGVAAGLEGAMPTVGGPMAVERYRQFNNGRQQAFLEARRSVFEGAPAACALGMRGGPLRVFFLAGRRPPVAIENPRQVSAYRYPDTYGPRSPTFSRAAMAEVGNGRQALFISGTASIVGHATVNVGDVRRQTEECLANIAVVREGACARARGVFAASDAFYTIYVRSSVDLPVVRDVFERAVGARSSAAQSAVYLQADICRADLLVEIEAHAFTNSGMCSSEVAGAAEFASGRSAP